MQHNRRVRHNLELQVACSVVLWWSPISSQVSGSQETVVHRDEHLHSPWIYKNLIKVIWTAWNTKGYSWLLWCFFYLLIFSSTGIFWTFFLILWTIFCLTHPPNYCLFQSQQTSVSNKLTETIQSLKVIRRKAAVEHDLSQQELAL